MGISFTSTGSFDKTVASLKAMQKIDIIGILNSFGQEGVNALIRATPYDTGLAEHSWGFKVSGSGGKYEIAWTNTDLENGFRVVIMLQHGYATGTGGYVQGRDFINPAMRPIFDHIADKAWKAVTSA
jgi:hypothetical protein